jgi:hypothetical protein
MVGEFGATDALLRARRERPRGRAADERDEVAAFPLTKMHPPSLASVAA